MKRLPLILILSLFVFALSATVVGRLDGPARISKMANDHSRSMVLLTANKPYNGIGKIHFGDIVAVDATRCDIDAYSASPLVKAVHSGSHIHLMNDSSRSVTHVSQVLSGKGLDCGYDGSGVVVGIIDSGVDFNHLAFRDSDGHTRIERVYLPAAANGNNPVVDGDTLPGRDYFTPEQIESLTTDDSSLSHGTHTTGIAAGSDVLKYGGMAPKASLMVVAMPQNDINEVNIACGAKYIASWAKKMGKPCVINISMGNHDGPHDGSGLMARVFDNLTREYGCVFVLSAGNEGNTMLYVNKQFTATDNVLSSVMRTSAQSEFDIDAWSRGQAPLTISYSVVNTSSGEIVAKGGAITCDSVVNFKNDEAFSAYVEGTATLSLGNDPINGKYRIYASHDCQFLTSNYRLAFSISGQPGEQVDVWDVNTNAPFYSCGAKGFSNGSAKMSISDMATGATSISVGACSARNDYPLTSGATRSSSYRAGTIPSFSSYGEDVNGIPHPFISAPGATVVSSVSRFNGSNSTASQSVTDGNGIKHYWYVKSGTSMSAPCVTGIVALWMQACNNLDYSQIKDVMASTAQQVGTGIKWGAGLIDAYAGLKTIVDNYSVKGDVNADGIVDIIDVNVLINIILGSSNRTARADLNADGMIDVVDLNILIDLVLNGHE